MPVVKENRLAYELGQLCHTDKTISHYSTIRQGKLQTSDWLTRGGGKRSSLHFGRLSMISARYFMNGARLSRC